MLLLVVIFHRIGLPLTGCREQAADISVPLRFFGRLCKKYVSVVGIVPWRFDKRVIAVSPEPEHSRHDTAVVGGPATGQYQFRRVCMRRGKHPGTLRECHYMQRGGMLSGMGTTILLDRF